VKIHFPVILIKIFEKTVCLTMILTYNLIYNT